MNPMGGVFPFIRSYDNGEKVAPKNAVGRTAPGLEAKVVDADGNELGRGEVGRLAIRGPTGIAYWQNDHPEIEHRQRQDTLDGWSLLDDVYRRDEDGWLWFETRLDNMIVTAGRQIAAPEVEEVLNEHPTVAESAVIGKPDETRGEIVKAFVVLSPGQEADEATIEALQAHAKTQHGEIQISARDRVPRRPSQG